MAKHEFGIMTDGPVQGVRYDSYEPWKYNCISIHDDYIEPLLPELDKIDFFWHSIDNPGKGLAYCGITLIPPSSMGDVLAVLGDWDFFAPLRELLVRAKAEKKFIIHFGI